MKRILSLLISLIFLLNTVLPCAAVEVLMPSPGTMVSTSERFTEAGLKGIRFYPEQPLKLDFIFDQGEEPAADQQKQSERTIRYFLAALTVPMEDLWVNLSPHEKDRIIADQFGLTEMGRDLLAQDYLLKQLTASLLFPDRDVGKDFWSGVYQKAASTFGTTDIPLDTFNKVWIVPDQAEVYETPGAAIVTSARLKVMLEADYLAMNKAGTKEGNPAQELARQQLRETVIPALEKEVNEGKNFAPLRQVYLSLVLAAWYRQKVGDSLFARGYIDRNKVRGAECPGEGACVSAPEDIWQRYVDAFKQGAFNLIREEYDEYSSELIPRKYFSGGVNMDRFSVQNALRVRSAAENGSRIRQWFSRAASVGRLVILSVGLLIGHDAIAQERAATNNVSLVSGWREVKGFNDLFRPLAKEVELSLSANENALRVMTRAKIAEGLKAGTVTGPPVSMGRDYARLVRKVWWLRALDKTLMEVPAEEISKGKGRGMFSVRVALRELEQLSEGDEFSRLKEGYADLQGMIDIIPAKPGKPTLLYVSPTSGFPFYKLEDLIAKAEAEGYGLAAFVHDPVQLISQSGEDYLQALENDPHVRKLKADNKLVIVTMSGSSSILFQAAALDSERNGINGILHGVPVVMWVPVLDGSAKTLAWLDIPRFIQGQILRAMEKRLVSNVLWNNAPFGHEQATLRANRDRIVSHLGRIHLMFIKGDKHAPNDFPWDEVRAGIVTDETLNRFTEGSFTYENLLWIKKITEHGGVFSVFESDPENFPQTEKYTLHEFGGFFLGARDIERSVQFVMGQSDGSELRGTRIESKFGDNAMSLPDEETVRQEMTLNDYEAVVAGQEMGLADRLNLHWSQGGILDEPHWAITLDGNRTLEHILQGGTYSVASYGWTVVKVRNQARDQETESIEIDRRLAAEKLSPRVVETGISEVWGKRYVVSEKVFGRMLSAETEQDGFYEHLTRLIEGGIFLRDFRPENLMRGVTYSQRQPAWFIVDPETVEWDEARAGKATARRYLDILDTEEGRQIWGFWPDGMRSRVIKFLQDYLADKAMGLDKSYGGIDLKNSAASLVTSGHGGSFKFEITEDLYQQLLAADGLTPTILESRPLHDLSGFMGLELGPVSSRH